jgi:hypothetical protein
MLMRDSVWESIREQFSEEEKVELRKAVKGETICPRGFVLHTDELPKALDDKLYTALQSVKRP